MYTLTDDPVGIPWVGGCCSRVILKNQDGVAPERTCYDNFGECM